MRAIIISLASLLLAPVIAGLVVEIAKPWLPPGATIILWATAVLESALLPWVVAGAGGLLVGMWLDRISAVFDGRNPLTAAGKLRKLALDARYIANDCELATSPYHQNTVNHNSVRASILILSNKLTKLGIAEPYIPEDASPWLMFHNVAAWLRAIHPAMVEGDVSIARHLASLVREGQIKHPVTEPLPVGRL